MQTRIAGIVITPNYIRWHNNINTTSNLNHFPNNEIIVGMANINLIKIMQTR